MSHSQRLSRGSKGPWDLSWAPWVKFGTLVIRCVSCVGRHTTTGASGFICCKMKPFWFTWCVVFGWTSQVFSELMKRWPVFINISKGTQQRYPHANRRSGTQKPNFFHAFCLQMPCWRGPNSLGEWKLRNRQSEFRFEGMDLKLRNRALKHKKSEVLKKVIFGSILAQCGFLPMRGSRKKMTNATNSMSSQWLIPCVNTYVKAYHKCFKTMCEWIVYLTHSSRNDHGTTFAQVGKICAKFRNWGFESPHSQSCQDWASSPVTSD